MSLSHFNRLRKAYLMKRRKTSYEKEKKHSIKIAHGEAVDILGWYQKCRNSMSRMKKIILKTKCWRMLQCPRRFLCFFLIGFLFFLLGLLLAYLFFALLLFQLHLAIHQTTLVCLLLGIVLSLGLAFNAKTRCYMCLVVPQLCSKKGRTAMIAYAYMLILTGPTFNTLRNIGKVAEVLLCNEELLKKDYEQIKYAIKAPFIAFKKEAQKIIQIVKDEVNTLLEPLKELTKIVAKIVRTIEKATEWLTSMVHVCNKALGTPYNKCMRFFGVAEADCQSKMGPAYLYRCSKMYVSKGLCFVFKPLPYLCEQIKYAETDASARIRQKLRECSNKIHDAFFVDVQFHHEFTLLTNTSSNPGAVKELILMKLHAKIALYEFSLNWFGSISLICFLILFFRVWWYHRKWMTRNRYDNHFINSFFREIDVQRSKRSMVTLLPLSQRERPYYISMGSCSLLQSERIQLIQYCVFLLLTSVKMGVHIGTDYCLYWILERAYYYGLMATNAPISSYASGDMRVVGSGMMAPMLQSISKLVLSNQFLGGSSESMSDCFSRPSVPDYNCYIHVACILLYCWVTVLLEPYILRLRNHVMCLNYPARARQRALWLYRDILRHRDTTAKIMRRQLRSLFVKDKIKTERITVREYMVDLVPCLWLRKKLTPEPEPSCLMCAKVEDDLIKCPTAKCIGLFCPSCWTELGQICSICKTPKEYGDYSDFSEEVDSSDEEILSPPKRSSKFMVGGLNSKPGGDDAARRPGPSGVGLKVKPNNK